MAVSGFGAIMELEAAAVVEVEEEDTEITALVVVVAAAAVAPQCVVTRAKFDNITIWMRRRKIRFKLFWIF